MSHIHSFFDLRLYCHYRYCECFQASIVCTERCRCTECKNYTDSEFREKAIQKLKEVNAEFLESAHSADPKSMDPASLFAYYVSETGNLYDKLVDKVGGVFSFPFFCNFVLHILILCVSYITLPRR